MISYDFIFYIPITLVFLYLGYRKAGKDVSLYYYLLTFFLAITYINCAIDKLFFPIFYDVPEAVDVKTRINLEFDLSKMEGNQIFYNVLVTVPLAICLLFIFRSRIKNIVLSTVVSTILIEIIQLIILITVKPGNVYFDILDIFLNVIGGLIGCVLLLVVRKIATYIKINGFLGYVADTLRKN